MVDALVKNADAFFEIAQQYIDTADSLKEE